MSSFFETAPAPSDVPGSTARSPSHGSATPVMLEQGTLGAPLVSTQERRAPPGSLLASSTAMPRLEDKCASNQFIPRHLTCYTSISYYNWSRRASCQKLQTVPHIFVTQPFFNHFSLVHSLAHPLPHAVTSPTHPTAHPLTNSLIRPLAH